MSLEISHNEIYLLDQELWIDTVGAKEYISTLNRSEKVKAALFSLEENGFCVLKNLISKEVCDKIVEEFKSFLVSNCDESSYVDRYGLHDRLASFHLHTNTFQSLYNQPLLNEILSLLFCGQVAIFGSLFFERGSEQDFHRDTPAFFTNPLGRYVGCWYALEDIDETQGPLVYYLKSHRIDSDYELRKIVRNSNEYQMLINSKCVEKGLEQKEFQANKGDVLIWHPQLVHRGKSRVNKSLSRYSAVIHMMAKNSLIHSPDDFFSGKMKLIPSNVPMTSRNGYECIDHGDPRFFYNRAEGNFDEF